MRFPSLALAKRHLQASPTAATFDSIAICRTDHTHRHGDLLAGVEIPRGIPYQEMGIA